MPPADNNRSTKRNIQPRFPEKGAELRAKLGSKRFVMRQDERWTIQGGNYVCHREGFSRSRYADERLRALSGLNSLNQRGNRRGLISRWLKFADELEFLLFHFFSFLRIVGVTFSECKNKTALASWLPRRRLTLRAVFGLIEVDF